MSLVRIIQDCRPNVIGMTVRMFQESVSVCYRNAVRVLQESSVLYKVMASLFFISSGQTAGSLKFFRCTHIGCFPFFRNLFNSSQQCDYSCLFGTSIL